jgi:hypothetical protein
MRGHRWYAIGGLVALSACALIATGCGGGGDDSTKTTTSPAASAQQTVDSAVKSCTNEAEQIGGTAGTKLEGVCVYIGTGAKGALSSANAKQALSELASGCRGAIGQLPSGQAQDAVSKLCDAVASAE